MATKKAAAEIARARSGPRRSPVGAMNGRTAGRGDKIPLRAPAGSYVIPADVVAALGEGNTAAGMESLSKRFHRSASGKSKMANGGVAIKVSDGEFIVSPEDVTELGGGDASYGHAVLEAFCKETRAQNIEHLSKLPSPKR